MDAQTAMIVGAVAGCMLMVLLAGPAGLLAGGLLANIAYGSIGAVIGAAAGAGLAVNVGVAENGDGVSEVSNGGSASDVIHIKVSRENDRLLFFSDEDEPLATLESQNSSFGQETLSQCIGGLIEDTVEGNNTTRSLKIDFTNTSPAFKDLIVHELRNQGINVSKENNTEGKK